MGSAWLSIAISWDPYMSPEMQSQQSRVLLHTNSVDFVTGCPSWVVPPYIYFPGVSLIHFCIFLWCWKYLSNSILFAFGYQMQITVLTSGTQKIVMKRQRQIITHIYIIQFSDYSPLRKWQVYGGEKWCEWMDLYLVQSLWICWTWCMYKASSFNQISLLLFSQNSPLFSLKLCLWVNHWNFSFLF